ncbi:MAG: protein-disulfide reductase DsbD domain-containing protein [Pyrinomonadaceae bacterium]
MIRKIFLPRIALPLVAAVLLVATQTPRRVAAGVAAAAAPVVVQANIGVNGFFSADKAQRGRIVQVAIVLDIPNGFHVNANKTAKFSIPTTVKIDAPTGLKISPVAYPRAVVRRLGFSKDALPLYEGRAVMRFNVTVPPNFETGLTELRAKVNYQSCNNEVCFPPTTREVKLGINVVGANEPVKRINGQFFGGRR